MVSARAKAELAMQSAARAHGDAEKAKLKALEYAPEFMEGSKNCGCLKTICGCLKFRCDCLKTICGCLKTICGCLKTICGCLKTICGWLRLIFFRQLQSS